MLNAYFGPMPEAIYNTAVYFKNTYRDSWITDPMSVEMIKDVTPIPHNGCRPPKRRRV